MIPKFPSNFNRIVFFSESLMSRVFGNDMFDKIGSKHKKLV